MPHFVQSLLRAGRRELGMFTLLVILCLFAAIATIDSEIGSMFLQVGNLQNVIKLIGLFGIFSLGVGIVIITGGIDLSIGSLMALLGAILFLILSSWGDAMQLSDSARSIGAVAVVLLLGALIGVLHGFFIAKVKMQAFIVTLCGLLAYRGLARVITNETTVSTKGKQYDTLSFLSEGSLLGLPMPFLYLILFAIILYIVLHKSVYGRYIYAAGRNETATRYSGINTNLVIGSTYVICAVLTAFSGILFCFYTQSVSASTHGNFYELKGIAAAVIGGCSLQGGEGSILGILIGTAILIVLGNTVNLMGWPSATEDVIIGLVIFLGVLFDIVLPKLRKSA